MRTGIFVALFALVWMLIGCSSGSDPITGSNQVIVITTPRVNLAPGAQHQFSASITTRGESPEVSWAVAGGPANGTITADGLYTAPNATGTYQVIVTSLQDAGLRETAEVTVTSGVNITIAPQNPTIFVETTRQFTATITGSTNTNARFSVPGNGSGGTITADGLYTAPATPGTYEVQAVADADSTRIAKTFVTVLPGVRLQYLNKQTDYRAIVESTIPLRVNVTGTTNRSMTWEVLEGAVGGTVDANGLYTAGTTPGFYTVRGTANADPTQTVTVTVRVVTDLRIRVDTSKGFFFLKLRPDKAPNHVKNLVSLTNAEFYDGIIFHRYEPSFVIQGGDPLTKTLPLDDPQIGTGGPGYTIDFEANDLVHNEFSLGMARAASRDSGGSQWYICLNRLSSLDGDYVVFGQVDAGTHIVTRLRRGDVITRMTCVP